MSGMAAAMLGGARDGQAETNAINKSISNLMRCLNTVRANQNLDASGRQNVVPWRDSKLTQLFQYHLEVCRIDALRC